MKDAPEPPKEAQPLSCRPHASARPAPTGKNCPESAAWTAILRTSWAARRRAS